MSTYGTPTQPPWGDRPIAEVPRDSQPRPVKRYLKIAALVVVGYWIALAVVFGLSVTKGPKLPASTVSSSGTNYLLVGSDSRAGLTKKQRKEYRTGRVEGQRTDTIMLMHVPWVGTPTLVSIPRDSWVGIPGYGENKINAAFSAGGPNLLVQTVEGATGLEIDHYVEIGFAGIANVTNAMGGVKLCPKQSYDDSYSGLKVKAGCQRMNGKDALAYVRMRYQDPEGDLGRAKRQQEFISSVAKRALNPLTWLLPWRAFGAAHAAGQSLVVDKQTGIVDDGRLALAMGMIALGAGESTTVPTEPGTFFANGTDALKWDTPKALELFNSLD